jgi:hypothetical protein
MKTRPSWSHATAFVAALVLLVVAPDARAKGGAKAGHAPAAHHESAGHAGAQHQAAPHRAPQAPKVHMPKAPKMNVQPQMRQHQTGSRRSTGNRTNRRSYARHRGYSTGRRYASNSGNSRAIIQRLRSTRTSLSQVSHPYQGHRVKAIYSISQAIRQLEHRSGGTNRTALASTVRNTGNRGGNNRGNNGLGAMSQAQSNTRMRQAMQTLQSIHRYMTNGSNNNVSSVSYAQARSSGSVRKAAHELNLGLRAG